jgi:hypothetical protein
MAGCAAALGGRRDEPHSFANEISMKRALSNSLIVLVSLLVTAAIVEAVLREFLPMYPDGVPEAFQYDPELALRHRPGIHLFWTRDFQQEIRIKPSWYQQLSGKFR